MEVRRFHSPFRHWLSGLGAELAVFAIFLVVLVTVSVAAAYLL